ncbi:MAG: diaminopimelate decarboxylase [Pseudomonadales bacterium]|jgi:diaminopimelate decarboxylase|uniref:diaminopimelate decarboxylase n=1 Tax=unclassified Ketobacter TaxID=2639109 RepID=UPI000C415586|nr:MULTISPECIES: diaminopimelate decarboxylase [unclassified Ketobacter]MAQ23517.1 diaminopimelate decarboxylase [Pseudomonadales bacterium]MEC8813336.1 diaminopimelate decarboxylase [Pseudomonadota bacterium]TNC88033.1 MAG: diaminopimelate decarboxylase [Alcanivorax sp.]HAG93029.1 diaminopimelate decarboxylase [Gammaproteobacteria bacterium]MBI27399.1 diaminopimelate decarboxylase [Pseudomonadales bacterium]|tara:strand:- start:168 stop:1415 length:1248 start_codon:yes stop_codon:yes gene_type:complete
MSVFEYRNNALFAENLPVDQIAKAVGTPCYLYSRKALETAWQAFDHAFGQHPHLVCYAVKANSNLAVLNVLAKLGAGFDIVSQGELERVLRAGGDPAKVVFSGVGKLREEMVRALQVGVYCFNVESEAELEILSQVAVETGKTAAISLRVNPDVDAQTHPYISTGLKQNKFGIDIDRAIAVFQRAAELPNIKVSGIDCHIGSQLTTVTPFMDAMDRLLERIDQLAANGIHIEHVDIGGGLGVRYRDEQPPAPADYVSALLAKLGDRKLKVVMEPGRAIAANAGIMVTEVQLLKSTEIKNFVVVDAAMNDMIRPSLYSAWQDIIPVQPTHQGEAALCDVVGPVCETGDFLGKDRELNVKAGDLLAVCSAGAYGFVMSSNYNTRNRAPEVMVDDDRFHIIRRRETYEDQFALESLVP